MASLYRCLKTKKCQLCCWNPLLVYPNSLFFQADNCPATERMCSVGLLRFPEEICFENRQTRKIILIFWILGLSRFKCKEEKKLFKIKIIQHLRLNVHQFRSWKFFSKLWFLRSVSRSFWISLYKKPFCHFQPVRIPTTVKDILVSFSRTNGLQQVKIYRSTAWRKNVAGRIEELIFKKEACLDWKDFSVILIL